MNKSRLLVFAIILFAAAFAAGCSNEVDTAISKLGGNESEKQQAMGTLLAVPGAKDKLKDALLNMKRYDAKTRKQIALLIGQQAESSNDSSATEALEKALAKSERDVRIEILNALGKAPGDKALIALQNAVDDKDASVGRVAWEILDLKAKEIMAGADKLDSSENGISVKIDIMQKALKINPCNPGLSAKIAGLYREAAGMQPDKETEFYKKAAETEKVCGAFVRKMYLAWPFDADLKKVQINTAKIDLNEDMDGADGMTINWEEYELPEDKTVVDMRLVTEDVDVPRTFTTYGAFSVKSDKPQDVFFRIGADVPALLWVNGKKIIDLSSKQVDIEAEKKTRAALRKGNNIVVFKVTGSDRSRFKFRISDTNNKEAKGLSF